MVKKKISALCPLDNRKNRENSSWYLSVTAEDFDSAEAVDHEIKILENYGLTIIASGNKNNKFVSAKMEDSIENITAMHWKLLNNWIEPKPDQYQLDYYNPDLIFPWDDVNDAIKNGKFKSKKDILEAKINYGEKCKPCPKCRREADQLFWLYFMSAQWTWESMCGRGGWLVICEKCNEQVEFFGEMMN